MVVVTIIDLSLTSEEASILSDLPLPLCGHWTLSLVLTCYNVENYSLHTAFSPLGYLLYLSLS